jgi:hypothetical protein
MVNSATTSWFCATTMLEKRFHNHYYNQTNPKPQPKPKTNPKKQPEKKRAYTKQTNNNQKENSKKTPLTRINQIPKYLLTSDKKKTVVCTNNSFLFLRLGHKNQELPNW